MSDFVLSDSNYFSPEASKIFMGSTQFKSFSPEYGGCEAKALAELNGIWKESESTALLVGSYVHAHFEGELNKFKSEHPQIFTVKGELKAEYKLANEMINALETDDFVMNAFNAGKKEVFMTGELFGAPWKIKVDCLDRKNKIFIDLQTTKDFEHSWSTRHKARVNFVLQYNYLAQFAIYQEIIRQNTGERYMPFLIAVTKQSPPDKAILSFDQESLDEELKSVGVYMQRVIDVKTGKEYPVRCNKCDYCRATKKVDIHGGVQHYASL
jgi:hypothetical protein